jgi:hypothetical protein
MILCVGVAGSGKSMLLRSLKDRSAALFEGYVPEVVDPDEPPPPPGPAPLLASIATIGTDFVKISKPSDKRNSPPEGWLSFQVHRGEFFKNSRRRQPHAYARKSVLKTGSCWKSFENDTHAFYENSFPRDFRTKSEMIL